MTVDEARLAAENLAADQGAAAAPTDAVAPPVESIGLALSGGGIRAALFSVGPDVRPVRRRFAPVTRPLVVNTGGSIPFWRPNRRERARNGGTRRTPRLAAGR